MDDTLTMKVLGFQQGQVALETVRNLVLLEAYQHLSRYRRKGEDEVSDFLLDFHGKIEGLLGRFRPMGLPFRHFLLRTLKWQWNTFLAGRARSRRQEQVAADVGLGEADGDYLAEPGAVWNTGRNLLEDRNLTPATRKRLVLLALKSAPHLGDGHLEAVSRTTGADLIWLQGCQQRLREVSELRHRRRERLTALRGDAFCRRLMAEDDAQREPDPGRKRIHEERAGFYRSRLASLDRRRRAISPVPTHRELADLLGMPKGSVDSGLHHLKKDLSEVYIDRHDNPSGDQ